MKLTSVLAIVTIAVVFVNLLLLSFRVIDWGIFWVVLIIAAFIAYLVIPYLKKKAWEGEHA